jgi:hypothetical protein
VYDAVATMDTVTLIRSGIRGLLKVAGAELGAQLRSVISRDDDYTDFALLVAAVNLARFGVLGLTRVAGPGWAVTPS